MKKVYLLLTLVLFTNILSSQNQEWLTYDLDSIVSIEMPYEVFEMDTIMQGRRLYQIYSQTESATFIAQKVLAEEENQDEDLSKLPYDLKSLNDYYAGVTKGITASIHSELETKEPIEKENFKGYRLKYYDSLKNPSYEVEVYLLNKHLYSFFYMDLDNLDKSDRDLFFKSIEINASQKVSQYLGKSQEYRIGYVFGKYFFYILIFGVIIYFIVRKKKN